MLKEEILLISDNKHAFEATTGIQKTASLGPKVTLVVQECKLTPQKHHLESYFYLLQSVSFQRIFFFHLKKTLFSEK